MLRAEEGRAQSKYDHHFDDHDDHNDDDDDEEEEEDDDHDRDTHNHV